METLKWHLKESQFTRTRLLIEAYAENLLRGSSNHRAKHLLEEVRGRVRQLQMAYFRLVQLEANIIACNKDVPLAFFMEYDREWSDRVM